MRLFFDSALNLFGSKHKPHQCCSTKHETSNDDGVGLGCPHVFKPRIHALLHTFLSKAWLGCEIVLAKLALAGFWPHILRAVRAPHVCEVHVLCDGFNEIFFSQVWSHQQNHARQKRRCEKRKCQPSNKVTASLTRENTDVKCQNQPKNYKNWHGVFLDGKIKTYVTEPVAFWACAALQSTPEEDGSVSWGRAQVNCPDALIL